MKKPIALLLLSGGKDSPEALRQLIASGWHVHGLCIDGIQGKEKIGAQITAQKYNISLEIASIDFFDEETWNPFKLIRRDVAMGLLAIKKAKAIEAKAIATGVKKSDLQNPKLWWLIPFLLLGAGILKIFGLSLLYPAWNFQTGPKA